MLRIAVDIRSLMTANRTGVGEYTYELLNALFKIDRQNQYFLFYNSNQDISFNIPQWKYDNVHYIHTHWPNKLFNIFQKIFKYPKIDKLICHCEERSNLVNLSLRGVNEIPRLGSGQAPQSRQPSDANEIATPLLSSGLTMTGIDIFFSPNLNFTALSKNIKHILTIHDLSFTLYPQYYSFKRRLWHKIINAKKQCQNADLILVPSKNTKRDLEEYFQIDPKKIKVLYPGINLMSGGDEKKQIQQKYNLPDNFILYLGTIEPRKNIIGLIESYEKTDSLFSPLITITPPYTLIIAGASGWKNKEIFRKAKRSNYKNFIKFIGYVEPADKPLLYSLAKVFIYPSYYEGFGFPVLEAMACSTPVITSNRSSLPEITQGAAYLLNPHKTDKMALTIKNLIENNKLREYYIQKGREQVKKFNWEKTAQEFLNELKNTFSVIAREP